MSAAFQPEWVAPARTALLVIDIQVDFAAPESFRAVQNIGNSGVPGSPHYRDQFLPWIRGEYHTIHLTRAGVQADTVATTLIVDTTRPPAMSRRCSDFAGPSSSPSACQRRSAEWVPRPPSEFALARTHLLVCAGSCRCRGRSPAPGRCA